MKRLLSVFAVVGAAAVLVASPASAAGTPCASNAEYSKVRIGMSLQRVQVIFDSQGKSTFRYDSPGFHLLTKEWKRCGMSSWHWVWVDFENGRVTSKSKL